MAKLKYKHYDYDCIFGPEDSPILEAIDMEEDGVIYTYVPREGKQCYVSSIENGVENVVVADEIYVDGIGICPVYRWGIPLVDKKVLKNVKSIKLGKNLKEFNELTTSDLENLEILTIPESLEAYPPFRNCPNLKELYLPDKFGINWEYFAWSHPKLQKVIITNGEYVRTIETKELATKRTSYQLKIDAEEAARKAEQARTEKVQKHEALILKTISTYVAVVCAVPYLWAIINAFKNTVNYDLGFFDILMQLIATCILAAGLLIAYAIAVMSSIYLASLSKYKILTAIFVPIVTIPFSWLVFVIAINILMIFASCSDGFYGFIDPRFL